MQWVAWAVCVVLAASPATQAAPSISASVADQVVVDTTSKVTVSAKAEDLATLGAVIVNITTEDKNQDGSSVHLDWFTDHNETMMVGADNHEMVGAHTQSTVILLTAENPKKELSFKAHDVGTVLFRYSANSSKWDVAKPVDIEIIHYESLHILSQVFGWAYFSVWISSFFPQIWTNFRRKSVTGLNFDFVLLNIIGFLAYTTYYTLFYFDPHVVDEYHRTIDAGRVPVSVPDYVFAAVALTCTLITGLQVLIYDRGDQTLSIPCRVISAGIAVLAIVMGILTGTKVISILTFASVISYLKVGVTFIKYMPQVYFNWRRKSTVGWSIWQMLLDLGGGTLSLAQQLVNGGNSNDWIGLFGNAAKTLLSVAAFIFDTIFIIQHYCLYPQREDKTRRDVEKTADSVWADAYLSGSVNNTEKKPLLGY